MSDGRETTGRGWHDLFEIGVALKGANAALEFLSGFALLFVNIGGLVSAFTADELVEDPDNFLANHLRHFANGISPHAQLVSALYLLAHGVVNAVLVWGLLRGKLWAYPAAIAVLSLFVAYQMITLIRLHSIPLAILTLFDLALIGLIIHEYRRRARRGAV